MKTLEIEAETLEEVIDIVSKLPRDPAKVHERFHREVWTFVSDFDAALAKALVRCSPYTVPDNLATCIEKFHDLIKEEFTWDENKMCKVGLLNLTDTVFKILEKIPEIVQLNERKNGKEGMGFSSRYGGEPDPDNDFIDIMAVAQNITCDFAEREDAQAFLDIKN
tara:strand:- start:559 stop:1053 length:495 start_codon:yes stop_codon:yes gene_type:complete